MILSGRSGSRFSEVRPLWRGDTAVLIGGGPSLTHEQIDIVRAAHTARHARCIAINDAYLWAPFADVLYFADARWFEWHRDGIDKPRLGLSATDVRDRFAAFRGQKCTISTSLRRITDDAVHVLLRGGREGLSSDPTSIRTGGHGGYQALNIATLAGAARALLLAFDARPGHFHGVHPTEPPPSVYATMQKSFEGIGKTLRQAGVTVLNCTPGSAIRTFPQVGLETALVPECVAA
jgi:hypothetical protein